MNVSSVSGGYPQNEAVFLQPPRAPNGDYIHDVRACKVADQPGITAAVDISDFSMPMKAVARYGFMLMIPYTVTGALVAMQWAVNFSDLADGIQYALFQITPAGNVVGGRSAVLGAAVGQLTAALGGGTPGEVMVFGSIATGANGGNLLVRAVPSGAGVSGTVFAGAIGHAWEI